MVELNANDVHKLCHFQLMSRSISALTQKRTLLLRLKGTYLSLTLSNPKLKPPDFVNLGLPFVILARVTLETSQLLGYVGDEERRKVSGKGTKEGNQNVQRTQETSI